MYKSLLKRYKDQPSKEIFAHFPYQGSVGDNWETPFIKLAKMAKKDKWKFQNKEFQNEQNKGEVPILINYLNYTFLRLQDEKKIAYSADGDKACINTGLQTPRGKDIYATFFKNTQAREREQPDWTLFAFVDSYSDKLAPFHPLPDIAEYILDPNDLVFNLDYQIEPNLDHFLKKNEERLPTVLQGNIKMAENVINGAIQSLHGMVKRNYKVAIPHWFEGKIQLLLPLVLTNDEGVADLALVVERDDKRKIYRGKTILTMDMAYLDARLITKPADEWLNP
ncbi:hypothetical protein C900_04152 [Fulvivirga imtechensis AK7]|uniref:DUF3825 domain-containing protein n=1 Tax=Fulvivirga imtechensis AK7 TaxID=1237149 RepID=L8JX01_9BACT|nr:DUF3825 domain-containing protein [Fulvivirga imtechensis]ELR73300.1 hypothetical protein C900_04152 [Fulvivirga imtechensis AK7]